MKICIGYIAVVGYLGVLILFASYLYHEKNVEQNITRKIIHIGSLLTWFMMVYFFGTSIHLVILPLIFIFVNLISHKFKIIKAMERDDSSSIGTIYYAISMFLMSLLTYFKHDFLPYYGIGYLVMAVGDGLAGIIGRKGKQKIGNSDKTYVGSLTIIISSFIIILAFDIYYKLGLSLMGILFYSLLSAVLEFYGKKGTDNLILPLGISVLSYLLKL